MIVNAFNDIPEQNLQPASDTFGKDTLNVAAMNVGYGAKSFKSDDQGIWLGADRFTDAPFSVDMEGNIIASSLDLSSYVSKTGTSQNLTGDILVGDGNIKIDGANKRIIINDGTNDRIIIGYQLNGF